MSDDLSTFLAGLGYQENCSARPGYTRVWYKDFTPGFRLNLWEDQEEDRFDNQSSFTVQLNCLRADDYAMCTEIHPIPAGDLPSCLGRLEQELLKIALGASK